MLFRKIFFVNDFFPFCFYCDNKSGPDGSNTNVFRHYDDLYADGLL